MTLQLSDIDFEVPPFMVHHYYVMGSIAIIINSFVFYLILFQSGKIDSFKYYMLSFQLVCSLQDIHMCFAMQPIPLFPIVAGHCAGFLSSLFHVSSHLIMTILSLLVGFQVNSLNACFLRKHQAIAKIGQKGVLSRTSYYFILFLFFIYTFFYTTSFFFAKIPKEKQYEIIEKEYPVFLPKFRNLVEFELYELNWMVIAFLSMIIGGCLQSILTVSFLVFQMYNTLSSCRAKLSKSTLEKHKAALVSLVAQFLTTPIGILPAMFIVMTVLIPFSGAQEFTFYMILMMTSHSTINSLVVISTFPEFRAFVMFWSKEGRRRRSRLSVSFVVDASGSTRHNF